LPPADRPPKRHGRRATAPPRTAQIDDEEVAPSSDDELEAPEDSAILPSAEGHLESEAPTMEIDCQENPELCAGDPLFADSEGPTLSVGDDPRPAKSTKPETRSSPKRIADPPPTETALNFDALSIT
jgi:hypothetical protein